MMRRGASRQWPPRRCGSNVEQHGAATLINDAYNSNPGSARAALELLQPCRGGTSARRGAGDHARAGTTHAAAARRRRARCAGRRRRTRGGDRGVCGRVRAVSRRVIRASLRADDVDALWAGYRVASRARRRHTSQRVARDAARASRRADHRLGPATTPLLNRDPLVAFYHFLFPLAQAVPSLQRLQLHLLSRGRRGGDGTAAVVHRRPDHHARVAPPVGEPGRARRHAGVARGQGQHANDGRLDHSHSALIRSCSLGTVQPRAIRTC